MKHLFVIIVAIFVMVRPAWSQGTLDLGAKDSVYLKLNDLPNALQKQPSFSFTLYCFNDQNLIRALSAGFVWQNSNMRLDSAVASETTKSSFNYMFLMYRSNSRDSSNKYRNFGFFALSLADAGLKPASKATQLATFYFSSDKWTTLDSVQCDTMQFSPGAYFTAIGENRVKYQPLWGGKLMVYDANRPCCISYLGNADGDPAGTVDIADLTFLLNYVYGDGTEKSALPCPEGANVDASTDGVVNESDIVALQDFLYGSMKLPAPCP